MSLTTVYRAYIELETRGLVEPRAKSGFFTTRPLEKKLPTPDSLIGPQKPRKVCINTLVGEMHTSISNPSVLPLGAAAPSPELLPTRQFLRQVKARDQTDMQNILTCSENPSGSPELRRLIAKRSLAFRLDVGKDDIIVTNGCMEAIHLCLRAVAEPGDTILVESPTFHCFLQLIEDLNMLALEIPTHSESGADIAEMEQSVDRHKVSACILNPNFQNPSGSVMPDDNKRAVVKMLAKRGIPIIEDDVYGDIYFGKSRPSTLKSYDAKGLVLYCSSFSKTLAPGLRVGWAIPGIYADVVKRYKMNSTITTAMLNQELISEFLCGSSYDRHLRRLRNAVSRCVGETTKCIGRYFPEGTKISSPKGGLVLWVQLPSRARGMQVHRIALEKNIAVFPGDIFSICDDYSQYIRINCANPWSKEMEQALKQLGQIVSKIMQ